MKETELKSEKFLASKSQKRLHRWGYKDSGFELDGEKSVTFVGNRYEVSGTSMPDFIPYIESVLGIEFNKDDVLTSVSKKPVNPPAINAEFFDEVKKPSRSTFAGSGLALGAKIEIECWAVKK